MDVEFHRRQTNGISLYCAEAGPSDGPLVFLLHGFPEFWYGWRHQIGPLARAGFHVLAPDQRGYDESDKPKGVAAYDLDRLAADIAGLADSFGRARFAVVGHDWGACVGWWTARNYPSRVVSLAVLNGPHPAVLKQAMLHSRKQRRLSRYVGFFGIPILPELIIKIGGYRLFVAALGGAKPADAFTGSDIAKYRAAWTMPGALTAMLNWYRAVIRKNISLDREPRLTTPVRIIWGVNDAYMVPELAGQSARLCEDAKILYLENATHWVAHDEPERVTRALLEFLSPLITDG
ncbi:MAG TPA: alpha/beta fold hydrolase [Rhizomicrobium sp.]|nr:alpha/beta fold hydrolase [Rhizomicrobium sp.]